MNELLKDLYNESTLNIDVIFMHTWNLNNKRYIIYTLYNNEVQLILQEYLL